MQVDVVTAHGGKNKTISLVVGPGGFVLKNCFWDQFLCCSVWPGSVWSWISEFCAFAQMITFYFFENAFAMHEFISVYFELCSSLVFWLYYCKTSVAIFLLDLIYYYSSCWHVHLAQLLVCSAAYFFAF